MCRRNDYSFSDVAIRVAPTQRDRPVVGPWAQRSFGSRTIDTRCHPNGCKARLAKQRNMPIHFPSSTLPAHGLLVNAPAAKLSGMTRHSRLRYAMRWLAPVALTICLSASVVLVAPHARAAGGDATASASAARSSVAGLLARARAAASAKNTQAVLQRLDEIERRQPAHRDAGIMQLYALTDAQEFERATARAGFLTGRHPRDAGMWLAAAYAWRHAGKAEQALNAYRAASRFEPNNADAFTGQWLMLRATGRVEDALALAVRPPVASAAVAPAQLDDLRLDAAASLIRRALQQPEGSAQRLQVLAEAQRLLDALRQPGERARADRLVLDSARGDHERVVQHFEQWFGTDAQPPDWATRTAAFSYFRLGDDARALALFERLLDSDPHDEAALRGRRIVLSSAQADARP